VTASEDALPVELSHRIQSDAWGQSLGIEYLELRRGYCRLALQLRPHMLNFQGSPHGGVIFSIADAAFAAACNSQGEPAVALSVTISYLAAPAAHARLLAEARERRQGRRAGFYDVTVSDEDGRAIAAVHCVAHRVNG
jgi:acyl-CoA thioesterase